MNIYQPPKAKLESEEFERRMRWNLIVAYRLFSKSFLLILYNALFWGLWVNYYFSVSYYMSQQGTDLDIIGRENLFFSIFSFYFVFAGLVLFLITGIFPTLITSYFQSKKTAIYSQLLWAFLVIGVLSGLVLLQN